MNLARSLAALCCALLICARCAAQDSAFVTAALSAPTDLSLQGWNRVLLLRDGRTVVLHIAPWEKMVVKVFDTAHREVASKRQLFRMISESALGESAFKGFYDIAGTPTLFMMQQIEHRNALFRICFNPDDGTLMKEEIMCEAPNKQDQVDYHVVKSPVSDEYAVFHLGHLTQQKRNRLWCTVWNARHQQIRKAEAPMPEVTMRTIGHIACYFHPEYGIYAAVTYYAETVPDQLNAYVLVAGLQPADSAFSTRIINFGSRQQPQYGFIQYNPFAATVNLGITCEITTRIKDEVYGSGINNHLIVLDRYTLESRVIKELPTLLKEEVSGQRRFDRVPVRMYTSKYGTTILLTESAHFGTNYDISKGGAINESQFGEICYRKFDDLGEEMSGNIFPKSQFVRNALLPVELAERGTSKYLFRDHPDQVFNNQFISFECLPVQHNHFVLMNDYPANMRRKPGELLQSVYDYSRSEAVYYRISSRDTVRRAYLFGDPAGDESRSLMIESIDYSPADHRFGALVNVRKGKTQQLCVAWCRLQ